MLERPADVTRLARLFHALSDETRLRIVGKLLGGEQPTLTIGTDAATAGDLEACGARHRNTRVDEVVVDDARRVVTTAAYMLAGRISEAAAGIDKLVHAVLRMA